MANGTTRWYCTTRVLATKGKMKTRSAYIGKSEEDAARAYDAIVRRGGLHGNNRMVNFPIAGSGEMEAAKAKRCPPPHGAATHAPPSSATTRLARFCGRCAYKFPATQDEVYCVECGTQRRKLAV